MSLTPGRFSLLHFFDLVDDGDEIAVLPSKEEQFFWLIKGLVSKPKKPEKILCIQVHAIPSPFFWVFLTSAMPCAHVQHENTHALLWIG